MHLEFTELESFWTVGGKTLGESNPGHSRCVATALESENMTAVQLMPESHGGGMTLYHP